MSSSRRCDECGSPIEADSPGDYCAQCLLALGLKVDSDRKPGDGDQCPEDGGQITSVEEQKVTARTEEPGDRIGRYRLLQEIGHGGCGVVYMAEQEEPVRRKVALKVIKLGMDTRQVIARFEAERQALALMDHPNIAKVLDAGTTDTGRPYFVMELVSGIKITEYCDQNHLTTQQRLDLFIQVCYAVQHAHQKGVIHRDIKPSNILVATRDGVPVPKLIDFGIAKATQGKLTDQTLFTAFEQFLGTPAYMSPEQAQLGSLDVDTRTDIYSLGVLLYELLTGVTPFDTRELVAAGLEEMCRTIREEEPPRPSTRLGRLGEKELTTTAQKRQSAAPRLVYLLRGDLDWIAMKCLEKARARRYETANGLARDLERHLNHEPVVARPPNTLYRVHKFIRRNQLMATTATAVATLLVLGIAISIWETGNARRVAREQRHLRKEAQEAQMNETRERQKAEIEAAKSRQVAQFLEDMVNGVGPSVAAGRDTTLLREILDRTAGRIAKDLTNQPEVAVELQNTIGRVYTALGETATAERMHSEALALATRSLGTNHPEGVVSLLGLALARGAQGKLKEAEDLDRQALALCPSLFPVENKHTANALNDLSRVLELQGEHEEADVLRQKALVLQRAIWGEQSEQVALSLRNLGIIRSKQGRQAEAEQLMLDGLVITRRVGTPQALAWSLEELAKVLMAQDKLPNAEDALKEALVIQRRIYETNHYSLRNTLLGLSDLLARRGKLEEAETHARAALAIHSLRPLEEREDPNMSFWIGAVFQKMGNLAEAEEWYRQAVLDEAKSPRLPPRSYISLVHALVSVLGAEGELSEIECSYGDWLRRARKPTSGDCEPFAHLLSDLAGVLMTGGKYLESEPLARECLEIRERQMPNDWRVYRARSLLGGCLFGQGRYDEAEPLLLSAFEGLERHKAEIPAESRLRLKEVLQRLAQLYETTGQSEEAAHWKERLQNSERPHPDSQAATVLAVEPER